ncbi:MAG: hypothetical protein LUC50_02125 [Ruminococcus sp.]|nr:hypothetical protein [Ruminococcus sp.]
MNTAARACKSIVLRLVLSFLLVFTLLGALLGTVGAFVAGSPALLLSEIHTQNAAEKVHNSLQTKFETQYNTTAVPAEVYMDVLTTQWLETVIEEQVQSAYAQMHQGTEKTAIDFTPLEESITAYFEAFAEENDYEIDDTYMEKLEEITENAESAVESAVDVYHFQTMQRAGILNRVTGLFRLLLAAAVGCGIVSLALILRLVLLRDHPCYWIGASLFADGVLLLIPAAVILTTGVIQQFALKETAVYAVVTGTMNVLTKAMLITGIVLAAVGFLLWFRSAWIAKSQPSKTEDPKAPNEITER